MAATPESIVLRAIERTPKPIHCWETLSLTTTCVASWRTELRGHDVVAEDVGEGLGADPDRDLTVGEVGERTLIALFTRACGSGPNKDIVIGSGDDAAVIDVGPTVISVDTAVQGRHFRLDWSGARQIGARTVVQSAADIAAMGARTVGVVVSIACPSTTAVGVLLDLNDGIVDAAHRLGARVLGGDLVEADQLVVSITSVGALDGLAPITLAEAQPGDVLAVSGPLGAAAAGLAVLLAGAGDPAAAAADVIAAYRLPNPDLSQGVLAARAGAHAMTDISDGLIEELITMARASSMTLSVRAAEVPRTDAVTQVAGALGVDADEWALAGGEDHELLAAFAPGTVPPGWTQIGQVSPGPARVVVDGQETPGLRGWQSFG